MKNFKEVFYCSLTLEMEMKPINVYITSINKMWKYVRMLFFLINICVGHKVDENCASKEEMCNESNNLQFNKYSEGTNIRKRYEISKFFS